MARRTFRKPDEVEAEVRRLLAKRNVEDTELLNELETLAANEPAFFLTGTIWAPELYRRNRVVFGPFVSSRLARAGFDGKRFRVLSWKDVARAFDPWLATLDEADDDPVLFQLLFSWKHEGKMKPEWLLSEHIVPRLEKAKTASEREHVFRKYGFFVQLEEEHARKVYALAPDAAPKFIVARLPYRWSFWSGKEERKPWRALMADAKPKDEAFYLELYRRQIPIDEWDREVRSMARSDRSDDALVEGLEQRHPIGYRHPLASTFIALLEQRGRGVVPYIYKHLREVFSFGWGDRSGYELLVAFAKKKGWTDFWAAVVRVCGDPKAFDQAVESVLLDRSLDDAETAHRLSLLAGASREVNFGGFGLATVHALSDENAVRLYDAFPDLLRGPFKPNVSVTWYGSSYPLLMRRAMEREDERLVDFIASRLVTRIQADEKQIAELAEYYGELVGDDAAFARRAASVLGQVPAYTIHAYDLLVEKNALARLFYQRSAPRYLARPAAIRDLLESPEIHAQALAFRALSVDDDRARSIARDDLDLLVATLLRPLHRKTRALAFSALEAAAIDEPSARRILDKAKEAMDLPDRRYPKDSLVLLMGRLLRRFPALCSDAEAPVVYRRGAA